MMACVYCSGEPEPGWIEMPNNGPIVPCPICSPKTEKDIAWERAERQRAAFNKTNNELRKSS